MSCRAPEFLRVRQDASSEYTLLDGTLIKCDRLGGSRASFSQNNHRHGMNVQVVAHPRARCCESPLHCPGRTHDPTAPRSHRIIRIWGVLALADRADMSRFLGNHADQTASSIGHNPDPAEDQPSPVRGASTGRTKRREAEDLAYPSPGPMQPQKPLVNLRSRSHSERRRRKV
ncbi:transposase family protein [Streptomyces sp. NPDC096205]|uniref:transposase family protein n=1 Tax=Streptomyces sp. NPDC096205 TaxID=3366081 RepID=UPI0037F24FE8